MRLIWSCAAIAALLVLSTGEASAQSQRGVMTVTVRVVRSAAPQTQTQTQTQLTETDGTSTQTLTDASGQPLTDATGQLVTTRSSDAEGNIVTTSGLAPGDVAAPVDPSATPLSRFRVLTINY